MRLTARGIPSWIDPVRLLGLGEWSVAGEVATAELDAAQAADVAARLRGVGLGGRAIEVTVEPPLSRGQVRAGRLRDARARRETTPGFLRRGTRVDREGKISLTPEAIAMALAARVAGRVVVDAGAGVGGNAIAFARHGCRVTAIERDAARLQLARHNARVYGVADRIRFVAGDALELLRELEGDVLFVDPPWGEAWNRTRTVAADFPLLGAALAARFRTLLAKLPPSFDPSTVDGAVPEAFFGEAPGDRHRVKLVSITVDVSRGQVR